MQGNNPQINVEDIPEFYAKFETDSNGFKTVWINPTEVAALHPVPNNENKTLIELANGRSYNVNYDPNLCTQLLSRCWMNLLVFDTSSHINTGAGVLAGTSVSGTEVEQQQTAKSGRR